MIAEFGCDIHHRKVDAGELGEGPRWRVCFPGAGRRSSGFCWWNESWENDDVKKHDTDMIILHDAGLTKVFREELGEACR